MKQTRLHRGKGFSLIEMLVVMAVILTLLGMILPSLQTVRDRAYTAVCANNLRQIGIAFQNYLGDNHGYYPGTGSEWGGSDCTSRNHWLAASPCNNPWTGYYDKRSGIFPYLGSKGVLLCPADPQTESPTRYGLSYVFNTEFCGHPTPLYVSHLPKDMISRNEIHNGDMARYILLGEIVDTGASYYDGHWDSSYMFTIFQNPPVIDIAHWHNDKGGLLYADGHVEFHKLRASSSSTSCSCTGAICNAGATCANGCPGAACSSSTTTSTTSSYVDLDPGGLLCNGSKTANNPLWPFTVQGIWCHY